MPADFLLRLFCHLWRLPSWAIVFLTITTEQNARQFVLGLFWCHFWRLPSWAIVFSGNKSVTGDVVVGAAVNGKFSITVDVATFVVEVVETSVAEVVIKRRVEDLAWANGASIMLFFLRKTAILRKVPNSRKAHQIPWAHFYCGFWRQS